MANPRHQHEIEVFRRLPLPHDKVLIPGVIDTTTNIVEHPEVVARRIEQAVAAVGDRERVIGGADCGFGTFTNREWVIEPAVWLKLRSLGEGADIASGRLWGRNAVSAHPAV
jgi:5-methyltetrahydropteroyltriglutamate--homocysteine methyltransferase